MDRAIWDSFNPIYAHMQKNWDDDIYIEGQVVVVKTLENDNVDEKPQKKVKKSC